MHLPYTSIHLPYICLHRPNISLYLSQVSAAGSTAGTCVLWTWAFCSQVLLVNILIAMMTETYEKVKKNADNEWRYPYATLTLTLILPLTLTLTLTLPLPLPLPLLADQVQAHLPGR